MHKGTCGLHGKGIHIPNSGGGGDGAGSIHQASAKRSIIVCYLSWRGFQVLQFVSSHMVSSYFRSCVVLIYSLVYVLTIGFIA